MMYVEWTSQVQNRKGRMVPLTALPTLLALTDPGYSSLYWFKEADAKVLLDAESSKGMTRFEVGGKYLILDLDDGDKYLDIIETKLQQESLRYEVWFSGGKGYHIYIPHQFVVSAHLPYSHKTTVLGLFPDAAEMVDMSLYQAGRLLSLPGRVHPKTGLKKRLLKTCSGKPLVLKIVEQDRSLLDFTLSYSENSMAVAYDNVLNLVLQPPTVGNRHTKLWAVAKDLAGSGLDRSTIFNILNEVNKKWPNPKSPEEVLHAVNGALKT